MWLDEFAKWKRFYKLEPFGPWMDRFMVARQTSELMNALLHVNRGKEFTYDHFMPKFQ